MSDWKATTRSIRMGSQISEIPNKLESSERLAIWNDILTFSRVLKERRLMMVQMHFQIYKIAIRICKGEMFESLIGVESQWKEDMN